MCFILQLNLYTSRLGPYFLSVSICITKFYRLKNANGFCGNTVDLLTFNMLVHTQMAYCANNTWQKTLIICKGNKKISYKMLKDVGMTVPKSIETSEVYSYMQQHRG